MDMNETDPYKILGVTYKTPPEEVAKIYKKLLWKYHPDRNPGNEEAEEYCKKVQKAWDAVKKSFEVPFPDIEPDDPGYDEAVSDWAAQILLTEDAKPSSYEEPPRRSQYSGSAEYTGGDSRERWHTVASSNTPGIVLYQDSGGAAETGSGSDDRRGDWTRLHLQRSRTKALSLEKITAEEAAQLIQQSPNAIAALKVLQASDPDMCLYEALTTRATDSKSLAVVGELSTDDKQRLAALSDPMRAIDLALHNAPRIAPHIKLDGNVGVDTAKLAIDLKFFKEFTEMLAKRVAHRSNSWQMAD